MKIKTLFLEVIMPLVKADERDTLVKGILYSAQNHPKQTSILSPYKDGKRIGGWNALSYEEVFQEIRGFASGLNKLGLKANDRLAVYSVNRPRWIISVDAIMYLGGTFVPIYPTTIEEGAWWIIHDSGAKAVVVGDQEQLDRVLYISEKLPNLLAIITMTPDLQHNHSKVKKWEEIVEQGKKNTTYLEQSEQKAVNIPDSQLAAIVYTSGTTGRPKGVMLTHKNFISQKSILPEFPVEYSDVWFGHLPLCHSFGFASDLLLSGEVSGTLAVLDSLDASEIRDGLAAIRPTLMSSVPRLWEKLYVQINQVIQTKPPLARKIFQWAIQNSREAYAMMDKKQELSSALKIKFKIATQLFDRVKTKAGLDRLKLSFTGGGPIHPELILFFRAIGIHLYQGYGLTETSPVANVCTPLNNKIGSVGKPIPGCQEKIDSDGEILIKGDMVMQGYYNNEEATRESLTSDGWLRTGDIGFIDNEGYLYVTDRKKELIVTSGGKNIAPQVIENLFNTDPYIEQVCVIGDNRKFISALVTLTHENILNWAKQEGIELINEDQLHLDPNVNNLIEQRIQLANEQLARFEQIKKFTILPSQFTLETGELTPSQKKKRRVINEKFKDQIETMYQ